MSKKAPPTTATQIKTFPWWGVVLILLGLAIIFVVVRLWWSYQNFQTTSGTNLSELLNLYEQSQTITPKNQAGKTNFLLLGSDELNNRDSSFPLTDTMMLASLDLNTNTVNLLSLPRDIYLPSLGNKINAIYGISYAQASASALTATSNYFSTWLDLPIDYQVLVRLADVRDLIDLVGGVDVMVVNSFTDSQYPRSDVDVSIETDPAVLYETVTFEAGLTHLDGEQALKFIRSRHGDNGEGNDYARSVRQQLLLTALSEKVIGQLRSELAQLDFTTLGKLYQFYQSRWGEQMPFVDLLAIGRRFLATDSPLVVTQHSLAIYPAAGALLRENNGWLNGSQIFRLEILNQTQLNTQVKKDLNYD